jgi:hypothetical protein
MLSPPAATGGRNRGIGFVSRISLRPIGFVCSRRHAPSGPGTPNWVCLYNGPQHRRANWLCLSQRHGSSRLGIPNWVCLAQSHHFAGSGIPHRPFRAGANWVCLARLTSTAPAGRPRRPAHDEGLCPYAPRAPKFGFVLRFTLHTSNFKLLPIGFVWHGSSPPGHRGSRAASGTRQRDSTAKYAKYAKGTPT